MAILSTVKKVIPYIKEAAGYVLCHISSQAVEMDDGTLLQDKIESMDSEIDGKANTSHTHTATQITGLTASRAMVSDGSGHPAVSNVTATELNCLDGATSNIQDQINTLNSNLSELNGNYAEYNYGGGVCQNEGQVTGNTITISESGTYLIWASAKNTGTSSTGFTELSIVINGTLCPLDIVSHEGVNLICTGIYMGNFQDGDQLYHRVFQNGGFPETINERYLRIIKLK